MILRNVHLLRAAAWSLMGLLAVAILLPQAALAACQIEYSDKLVHWLRQSGQYVSKYNGNYSSLAECEAARRDAISRSGDPSLASNMRCVGCDNLPSKGQGSPSSGGGTPPPTENAASKAAAKKYEAQKKAEQQAAQKQFQRDKQKLTQELKGVSPSDGDTLILRPVPPPTSARKQLDCVRRDSKASEKSDQMPPGGDWQNLRECKPSEPAVPEVPTPVPVTSPSGEKAARDLLATQLTSTRKELTKQDQEISRLEQEVAREESRPTVSGLKEAPKESDALKRAREALAKAKAARQQTAEQLRRLEEEEKASKNKEQ